MALIHHTEEAANAVCLSELGHKSHSVLLLSFPHPDLSNQDYTNTHQPRTLPCTALSLKSLFSLPTVPAGTVAAWEAVIHAVYDCHPASGWLLLSLSHFSLSSFLSQSWYRPDLFCVTLLFYFWNIQSAIKRCVCIRKKNTHIQTAQNWVIRCASWQISNSDSTTVLHFNQSQKVGFFSLWIFDRGSTGNE